MDNEINIGDEFFTTLALAGTNLTPSKNYICTGIGGDKGAAYKVYFIDDEGNEDWHFNNVFNKAKKATPVIEVKPHKWADVIHQWADGAEVEIKSIDGWVSIINPVFFSGCTYRVKPSAEDIQQETNKKIQQEVDKQYAKMTVAFNEYMAVSKSGQEYINNLKLGIK